LGKAWPALDIHAPGGDPHLQELVFAQLDDFQPTAIQEQDESSRLRAFFTTGASRDAAALALATSFGNQLFVERLDVEDEDWAARSQAELRAVTVGRVTVAPPWDAPGSDPIFTIFVKPSMAFGTGHHETTRLTLAALQEIALAGQTVLDVGCGSGVLALAAARLGARSAVGIDVDPDALANATENLQLNRLANSVRFEHADVRQRTSGAFVVVANLTAALLERAAARLADLVEPGGHLIVSGFTQSEQESVLAALRVFLSLQKTEQENEWLCARFSKSQVPPDVT
jgi:ribosomal protein L11 methyltransferase